MKKRCNWANNNELEKIYHDTEWGIPVHDDQTLFEFLILESMQAGLSWSTILAKRTTLTEAYDNFDYNQISKYSDSKIEELLNNPGVIRNKLKVKSAISNAKAFLKIQEEFGSFDSFIWNFVSGKTINNHWDTIEDVPASTELSDKISKELKERGFKFLGTTSVYAFMQSIGLVNDHMDYCFRK
ncbi:DNA-3-methyladenine glycosylase I [Enterococcus sp. AZ196]|uniref:DNA-3-methyladenine glycosylase I n=1 Tax=Enterococcus sp. AZ196 TaxID=2774659 RepID=UPI003D2958E4